MIGAWAGRASLANPDRDIAFCLNNGIDRLDIIVNDFSKARTQIPFELFRRDRILTLARRARSVGIEIHFMSWLMPYRAHIQQAGETLRRLAYEAGANSIQFDLEEPWTLAERPRLTYIDAASCVAENFANISCEIGANAIGWAPKAKVGPLFDLCSYVVPQCYSTKTQPLDPRNVVSRIVKRWDDPKRFDLTAGGIRIVPGLAAYRQIGIVHKGRSFTLEEAMRAAYADARKHSDVVIYWSLDKIRGSKRVTNMIRRLA